MLDQTEFICMRGDVIEKSIEIENLIAEIVTRHYFGTLFENARTFTDQVLDGQLVNFRAKTTIWGQIIEGWINSEVPQEIKLPTSLDLKHVKKHLIGIGDTRNLFAHCGANDPRFKNDPKKIYDHFQKLYKTVKDELQTIRHCFATRYPSKFKSRH